MDERRLPDVLAGEGTQEGQKDDNGLFYQRFDANGEKIGSETRLNTTVEGDQSNLQHLHQLSVQSESTGRYVVKHIVTVWTSVTAEPQDAR